MKTLKSFINDLFNDGGWIYKLIELLFIMELLLSLGVIVLRTLKNFHN